MQYQIPKAYNQVINQFRDRPTPALMEACLTLAALPIGDATSTALDVGLFILAERLDEAEFLQLVDKIDKKMDDKKSEIFSK